MKIRLDKAKELWVDELHHVLQTYQTKLRVPIGETPFSLAFGIEAVISIMIEAPSTWVKNYDEQTNSKRLRTDLDLLEEAQERAHIRMVTYQYKVARYYNSRVRSKTFKVGDLVSHKAKIFQPSECGKLGPN